MKVATFGILTLTSTILCAQSPVTLPEINVYSDRVANQSPAGTFAMPVSSLRYEPLVDIHARNLAEGQADLTIRGGIFENTGMQLGAVTVFDPQTGHYAAELPVAPTMLAGQRVKTGSDLALGATNATVGAVTFGWRPIRTTGMASVGYGEFNLKRAEIYQGYSTNQNARGVRYGADVALAHSKSDGSIPFGEHEFGRANLRLQRSAAASQTDVFAAYQGKRFGWPNLYTPFNSNETENLQTTLFVLNHRVEMGAGDDDFIEIGAYHRRNKDDYAFNRAAAITSSDHPFQHTTWVTGAAATARQTFAGLAWNFRAEVIADDLDSLSLRFGRYQTRTMTKVAIVPEKTWISSDGHRTRLKAGVAYDETNRHGGALSPVVELAREFPSSPVRRTYVSYTKTTQVPTYTALNSSTASGLFRGNPNLGRESSHTVEWGASGAVAGWTTQAALFWRRDDALVDWTFARGVTARTANAVDVEVGGFELVTRRSWSRGEFVLGYTALTKDAEYRRAGVDASFYALNYARHRVTAALILRLGGGFEVRMDNVARLQADNLLRTVGGDDALTSALGVSFRPPAWRRLEIIARVDNLWDSDFQDVPAVPAARRQLSGGVNYTW
jgi:vitamin B12 transporter